MNSVYGSKRRISDIVLLALIYLSAALAVAVLVGIVAYVFVRGVSSINLSFLTTVTSAIKGTSGILGNIVNTLYIIVITLIIAAPVGIGAAVYLTEYAKPGRLVSLIEFTTETLSGIPSIIYGLFGMVFFGTSLGLGFSILCGSLTLTLMVLPIIISTTQSALKTVPLSYRSGAMGIGATKWYMIRTIILPSAMPGIVTSVILSIGRIVGESAALLFTAGSAYFLPKSFFGHIFTSGGTLTIQMYLNMSKAKYTEAFGIAFILICIVLLINFLTKVVIRTGTRK
ncbi:MAG: phosphate ABC transporter permease PstA [Clostridiales bacterium]|nr:phosphate ABC transporter permease PstA [Clostridiales bacterium]